MGLLDDLRAQYEAARKSPHDHADVPGFQEVDAQMRKAFRWLEKAVAYLDELKPAIDHKFDLGHGLVFAAPRMKHIYVGQHESRIVGYPVLDEINLYYEISAARALTIDAAAGNAKEVERMLDGVGLQYTSRRIDDIRVEDDDGGDDDDDDDDAEANVRAPKWQITVPPSIPAAASFRADYKTGLVTVSLVNVDRIDRISLEFRSQTLDEPALEDLVRLLLGQSAAFLRRAPLAGLHGRARTA